MLLERELKALPESILTDTEIGEFVKLAENGDVPGINKRVKELGPKLKQNMRLVKESLKNSQV